MTDNTLLPQSIPASPNTSGLSLVKVWDWFTEPHRDILQPEQRRRARFLSGFMLLLIPLGFIISMILPIVTRPNYNPVSDPVFWASAITEITMLLTYWLSRTPNFLIGAWIILIMLPLATFGAAASDPSQFQLVLSYLVLTGLLGSLLLSANGTLTLALGLIGGILLMPQITPGMSYATPIFSLVLNFNIVVLSLVVVSAYVRQRDLAQIEEQSHALAEAVEQAKQANKLKDEFLANMSHELRTPLNAILGFTEVMLMGLAGPLQDSAKHGAERIHYNSERLLQLIDDILDVSKIEAGRVDLVRHRIVLKDLLANIENTLRPQAAAKNVEFETLIDPAMPPAMINDPKRLEQIIVNLTSNAIKFTDTGKVTVAFKRNPPDQWMIIVTDTGIGIPPHAIDLVFEKFRQVDGSSRRAYGGTGLGLAIVRELAALMGGTAKAESTVGKGSKFTVSLPLTEAR